MPRFAANLTLMFTEVPFLDRFGEAAKAGFDAVEFLFPYEHPAEAIAERLDTHGLQMALFNMPPGDWKAGERGIGAIPGREEEFRANAANALDYARMLRPRCVHAMAGITKGLDQDECRRVFVDNLRFAADLFAPEGITILTEPLNTRDAPGYFIAHQRDGVALCDLVDRPNVSLQFDVYHAQIMDGDLCRLIEALAGRFAHVQIASVPERHEPSEGEINYARIFETLDATGYDGFVGCEYNPRAGTTAGLGWFAPYRRSSAAA